MLTRRKLWGIFIAYVILNCLLIFTLTPMADDWCCAAAPYVNDGTWYRIFPMAAFWRPFEGLLAYFLGEYPFLFPHLNQFLVILGHSLLCLALFRGLFWYTHSDYQAFVGAAVFAAAPGVVSTTSQMDGINQCWALVFGVGALWAYFKGWQTENKGYFVIYVLAALVSTLFKENGISWFLTPVFLHILYQYRLGRQPLFHYVWLHKSYIVLGVIYSLLYFCMRFAVAGKVAIGVGESGRYAFHPTIGLIIKNFAIMHASAYTCLDTLALFLKPHQWIIFGVTAIITLGLFAGLAFVLKRQVTRKELVILVYLLLINMYNSLAQAVMHQVSEMSVYQMVFGFAFIIGLLWKYALVEKLFRWMTVVFLICGMCVSLHKFAMTHAYAAEIQRYMVRYQDEFKNMPREILIFYVIGDSTKGYSTYWQPAGWGLEQGRAFRCNWNWLDVDKHAVVRTCKTDDDVDISDDDMARYDTIFIQYQDGRVKVLKN